MKKFVIISMIFCSVGVISCTKDKPDDFDRPWVVSLMNGSIKINNRPEVTVTQKSEFPKGVSTETNWKRTRNRSAPPDDSDGKLRANHYRFELVAEISTLRIRNVEVQATHVKITDDGFAFVAYNDRGELHRGAVVVYRFQVVGDRLTVDKNPVASMEMRGAELSALDYHNGKLFMTGASSEPYFGYSRSRDGFNYAFFMVMELNPDKTFKEIDPTAIVKLASFQGTSIRATNNGIYITTGDGTNGTEGGLYIYDANDYSRRIGFIQAEHARSVDVDDKHIYLYQANHARVTKYDLDGKNGTLIYSASNEAMQKDAKSEILSWNQYLFLAANESGLRMLHKDRKLNDEPHDWRDAPNRWGQNWNKETEVTNSVAMNSDRKKNSHGAEVQSNLLLLANGESGIYWYEVMKNEQGVDVIVDCKDNSVLKGAGSANFIASKGNMVFVATGLGGLKVLYIWFNPGETPPPVTTPACNKFMPYLFNAANAEALLPESKSVFDSANPIVKKLFDDPMNVLNYIEITNATELYISYITEVAGWNNSLGFFVIPENVGKTDAEELAYYKSIRSDLYDVKDGLDILKDKYIIFKNVADIRRGGPLSPSTTYQIGNRKFNPGERVVLFLVPDGWSSQNNHVQLSLDGWNQFHFMHKGLNRYTRDPRSPFSEMFGDFKGVNFNTFYSADCTSMVLFFEDNLNAASDTDYNDIIFSISDNTAGEKIQNFKTPKYSIINDNGMPKVVETSQLYDK